MRAAFTASFLLLCSLSSIAQDSVSVQITKSVASLNGVSIFHTVALDREVTEVALGYSHPLLHFRHFRLDYHGEVIPFAWISDPVLRETFYNASTGAFLGNVDSRRLESVARHISDFSATQPGVSIRFSATRSSAYGGGIRPIGLEAHYRPEKRVQPFLSGSAGFLQFTRDEPIDHAAGFNFTFALGAGVEVKDHGRNTYFASYRFLHISNAETGTFNPGVNLHTISFGYRFRLKASQ
jgi:Lipid A 3-O-deacylase (PagL)